LVTVGFVSVLAVRVCVDPKLTIVSEALGKVYEKAPPTTNVLAKLPDIVSVLATLLATPVPPLFAGRVPVTPVESGSPVAFVNTPLVGVPSIGATSVLFVRVSVVARPTKVSVAVGKVNTPVFEMVAMIGAVNVLFVSVSVVALPTSVSVVIGNVSVGVPATAGVTIVAVPDVLPVIAIAVELTDLPAVKLLTATLTVTPD